jgi:CheY-like chemotaxis protein
VFPLLGWGLGLALHGVSVFVLGSGSGLRERMVQKERERLQRQHGPGNEARLKLLEAQLEPHMLFNTLANLRVLIATDPPRAQAMLDHLIAYLRATLSASRATLHPLAAEFDRLRDYLALMAVRMGPRLAYALDLPDDLRACPCPRCCCSRWWKTPSSTGWTPGGRRPHRPCARARGQRGCVLEVRDTGVGPARAHPDASRFGLAQVRERLATAYGGRGHYSIDSNPRAAGCTVSIQLPYWSRSHDHPHRPDRRRRAPAGRRPASRAGRAWPELRVLATVGDGPAPCAGAGAAPDVLFFDIRMPGLSGLDAAAELADAWARHGARPSPPWCSSPPTTSTPCRPSRRRRWTTCSSPCSRAAAKDRGQTAAALNHVHPHRHWPASAVALISACASSPMMKPFDQAGLPAAVQVPAGNKVFWETVGVGEITYECRAKAGAAGQFEWVFVGPDAKLNDRAGKQVGKYYGPPATWEGMDGVKLTATQVAVAPAAAGSIPLQLVKANPAIGHGHGQRHHLHPARGHHGRRGTGGSLWRHQHGRQADREIPGRLHLLARRLNSGKKPSHQDDTPQFHTDSSRVKSGRQRPELHDPHAPQWACGSFFAPAWRISLANK